MLPSLEEELSEQVDLINQEWPVHQKLNEGEIHQRGRGRPLILE